MIIIRFSRALGDCSADGWSGKLSHFSVSRRLSLQTSLLSTGYFSGVVYCRTRVSTDITMYTSTLPAFTSETLDGFFYMPWCREQLCSLSSLPPCHVAMAHRLEDLVCCGLSTEPFGTRRALRNPKQCARGKCGRWSSGPVLVSVQNQSFQQRTSLLDSVSKSSNTSNALWNLYATATSSWQIEQGIQGQSFRLTHAFCYFLISWKTAETYPSRPRRGTSFWDIPIPMHILYMHYIQMLDLWMRFSDSEGPKSNQQSFSLRMALVFRTFIGCLSASKGCSWDLKQGPQATIYFLTIKANYIG